MEIAIREINTTLDAFDLYEIFKGEDIIFLDSAKDPDHLGRYSFIGLNPFKKLSYKNGVLREDQRVVSKDPFETLNKLIRKYEVKHDTSLPFVGGCMGYFAYDLGRELEILPVIAKEQLDMPSLYFVFYNNIIVYDHHYKKVYLTELCRISDEPRFMDKIIQDIKCGSSRLIGELVEKDVSFNSPFTEATYMAAVERMRQYIKTGDIYIANMTHCFEGETSRDSLDIYRILRYLNPAPFSAYMPIDGVDVMCSSPERFMRIVNGKVETRPIKGTRPRGLTPEQDEANKIELESSEKDKSELLMIVDLERNDLSKVCRPYTVKVTDLFKIESYATVHHLVSTIVGKLREDQTSVDCLKSCFPGGSITGAPKIRAMEVIESLEPTRRHLYTGCIGYFGFDGNSDFNIVIRTIMKQKDKVYINVGGGITWESDPKAEYQETLDKAAALFRAVRTQEK